MPIAPGDGGGRVGDGPPVGNGAPGEAVEGGRPGLLPQSPDAGLSLGAGFFGGAHSQLGSSSGMPVCNVSQVVQKEISWHISCGEQ